jgi:hypothetical protein
MARLHDKGAFERLVTQLGLPIPGTVVVTSDDELRDATDRLERYFAGGVFSRGGVCCLTNTGPLVGALGMDEVHPSPASPWLVQPFLDGETVCTYSTAHQGRNSLRQGFGVTTPLTGSAVGAQCFVTAGHVTGTVHGAAVERIRRRRPRPSVYEWLLSSSVDAALHGFCDPESGCMRLDLPIL